MPQTPRLHIDYIGTGELQAFVTVNELIDTIDALVQTSVISAALSAPPGSPGEGDLYIVAGSPTGAWASHATHLAQWIIGTWKFYVPQAGWLAWNQASTGYIHFNGTAWVA